MTSDIDLEDLDVAAIDLQAMEDGRQAKAELALTSGAFQKLRTAMVDELIQSGSDAKILKLHMGLQMLDTVHKALLSVAQNGEIARQALAIETDLLRP